MRIADVAVATMTLARDQGEERLLRDALERLARLGMRVFVGDGGSAAGFVDAIAACPAVTMVPPEAPGLVGQVRPSLRAAAASGTPFILYTEPDKAEFFDAHLRTFLAVAPGDDDVGVVVASRSAAAYATFSPTQQRTEQIANELTGDLLGRPADYLYGPFLLRRQLADCVERVSPEIGWGWRPYLFVRAHRLGYQVQHVAGDYTCPLPDRTGEERVHRLRQLSQNVAGLALALAE